MSLASGSAPCAMSRSTSGATDARDGGTARVGTKPRGGIVPANARTRSCNGFALRASIAAADADDDARSTQIASDTGLYAVEDEDERREDEPVVLRRARVGGIWKNWDGCGLLPMREEHVEYARGDVADAAITCSGDFRVGDACANANAGCFARMAVATWARRRRSAT
jgi:hypothetical protein